MLVRSSDTINIMLHLSLIQFGIFLWRYWNVLISINTGTHMHACTHLYTHVLVYTHSTIVLN